MSPRILVWDIENSPALGWFWGKTYKTDIIHVDQSSSVMCFAAKWHGERRVEFRSDFHDGHEAMLERAWQLLDEADAVVSYNGKSHDTPHIYTEILKAGDGPPSPFVEVDLYRVVRSRFKFQQNRLNFVATELGLGQKVSHEGLPLWFACMKGDPVAWRRFRKYNVQDVNLTDSLLGRVLPWIPASQMPHMGLLLGVEDACSRCGGIDLERRGFAYTGLSKFQQYRCRSCGGWSRSKKSLEVAGMRGIQ